MENLSKITNKSVMSCVMIVLMNFVIFTAFSQKKDGLLLEQAANAATLESKVDLCNHLIINNPKNIEAYIIRGNAYFNMGISQKALQDFNAAITLDSKNERAYNDRGIVYFKLLNDKVTALKDFEKSISLNNEFVPAYTNVGLVYISDSLYNDALIVLNKAIF
jgi:tetratricopeptide (TPR) repeat protein